MGKSLRGTSTSRRAAAGMFLVQCVATEQPAADCKQKSTQRTFGAVNNSRRPCHPFTKTGMD